MHDTSPAHQQGKKQEYQIDYLQRLVVTYIITSLPPGPGHVLPTSNFKLQTSNIQTSNSKLDNSIHVLIYIYSSSAYSAVLHVSYM